MESSSDLTVNQCHLPYDADLVFRAREMRKHPTSAESKLWRGFLCRFPQRVFRQRPIAYFIVDFYCAALRLVIEVDGAGHFTEDGKAYDLERSRILEGYGLRIVRFTNREVLEEFEEVCQQISAFLQNPP